MRRLIFILSSILFLNLNFSLGQDVYPNLQKFKYINSNYQYDTNVYLKTTNPQFQINNFYFGWHWGNSRKLSNALQFNGAHVSNGEWEFPFAREFKDSVSITRNIPFVSTVNGAAPFQCIAMQFSPTLLVGKDSTKPNYRTSDSIEKNVFGFKNIKL